MLRVFLLLLLASVLPAQRNMGELKLAVTDSAGVAMEASGTLDCRSAQYHLSFRTGPDGHADLKTLPFGVYKLQLDHYGFSRRIESLDVRSELPVSRTIALSLEAVETSIVVEDTEPLLDTQKTGGAVYLGAQRLGEHTGGTPARDLVNLIDSQPGWLLEANGVLHPRGSEYQTQFVLDGMPMTDNRSPAFAPGLEANDAGSMNILTANYPAEYGRKLGGIIEVTSPNAAAPGWHGSATLDGGSFATVGGAAAVDFARGGSAFTISGDSSRTSRYLDSPVPENYTDNATLNGLQVQAEENFGAKDRVRLAVHGERATFEVPNELLQQQAGQRQDRTSRETMGQASWQHVFSPNLLLNVRGMVRDLNMSLRSNELSVPIQPFQDRGFIESYLSAILSGHRGPHEWKAGADSIYSSLHENFSYKITEPDQFDPNTLLAFAYRGHGLDREQSAFAQDTLHRGRFTLSAGLRFDRYSLLVRDNAFSPRLGVAWSVPSWGLVLHASYDRAFQTPATENLLLSSSAAVRTLNANSIGLPVPPSRGNFYQAGFAKSLAAHLRLDADYFLRDARNFADDDLLLNTGVSFPISFAKARVRGLEARLELPAWGRFSGSLNYSNMTGTGFLPITGGLLLDSQATALLALSRSAPITQDQRNTVHARLRIQLSHRLWAAATGTYGSGLPVEIDSPDIPFLTTQYGQPTIDRVNFEKGRVRPSLAFNASLGAELWKRERMTVKAQADVTNLTDRLNVIDFAGLFSGTALAPARAVSARIRFEF